MYSRFCDVLRSVGRTEKKCLLSYRFVVGFSFPHRFAQSSFLALAPFEPVAHVQSRCCDDSVLDARGLYPASFADTSGRIPVEMTESDDDEPRLSGSTLAALQEFYKEREERENELKKVIDEQNGSAADVSFDEDWVSWQTCNRSFALLFCSFSIFIQTCIP